MPTQPAKSPTKLKNVLNVAKITAEPKELITTEKGVRCPQKRKRKETEEKAKEAKPIRITLTERETNQLRDMLRQRIPSYREKIYRELHR